tara:strand:+ start:2767 stop:3303 length:537 start_codon:yes stop_codon:yes gene_type:complete
MALRKNPMTDAYEIDIEYKREDWGAEFMVPEAKKQMSTLTFDKANGFGFKVTAPFDFLYTHPNLQIPHTSRDVVWPKPPYEEVDFRVHDDGASFYTGLSIKLPPGTCFLILSLSDDYENYVLDNGDGNSFEQIRLYLKKSTKEVHAFEYTPILWILPIPDMAYSYQYRRKAIGKVGKK